MPNSNITEVYSKNKFQSIDEKKGFATADLEICISAASFACEIPFSLRSSFNLSENSIETPPFFLNIFYHIFG